MRRLANGSSLSLFALAVGIAALLPACTQNQPQAKPGAVAAGERYFPTGAQGTSAVLLRQYSPSEVRVGEDYEGSIDVVNLTEADLQNVSVNLKNLSNVHLVSSAPEWTHSNGEVVWTLPVLPAGRTETIRFHAKATAAGAATNCLSVSYANLLCASTTVVEPALQLAKSATPEVCGTCADITLTYAVRNAGTGVAENVVIKDTLASGLSTRDGQTAIELQAGDLPSGVERIFNISVLASRRGTFSSSAYATSTTGQTAQSGEASTLVRQPEFAFSCDANNRVFLGHGLDYRITVRNIGDCAASDVEIKAPVPTGCSFLSADGAGRYESGSIVWAIGSLPEGKATTVTMSIKPSAVGTARTTATAASGCVAAASTECSTEVEGVPAILLEVIDTVDPIEVGQETTFVVTAINQGSKGDSNVKVVATLPPSLEFVSGSGITAVTASGQTITMAPIASLVAGAKAEWRVVVRAKSRQDARSRWELSSDQFKVPVLETESTNLYE